MFVVACTRTTASRHSDSSSLLFLPRWFTRDAASLPGFVLCGIKATIKVNVGSSWARCVPSSRSQADPTWCHLLCVTRMSKRKRKRTRVSLLSWVVCSIWSQRRHARLAKPCYYEIGLIALHAHLCMSRKLYLPTIVEEYNSLPLQICKIGDV